MALIVEHLHQNEQTVIRGLPERLNQFVVESAQLCVDIRAAGAIPSEPLEPPMQRRPQFRRVGARRYVLDDFRVDHGHEADDG